MLLARVLLGESFLATAQQRNLHRPPDRADGSERHSVVGTTRSEGGAVDHREYIIYQAAQALPLFEISYKHAADCVCRFCERR